MNLSWVFLTVCCRRWSMQSWSAEGSPTARLITVLTVLFESLRQATVAITRILLLTDTQPLQQEMQTASCWRLQWHLDFHCQPLWFHIWFKMIRTSHLFLRECRRFMYAAHWRRLQQANKCKQMMDVSWIMFDCKFVRPLSNCVDEPLNYAWPPHIFRNLNRVFIDYIYLIIVVLKTILQSWVRIVKCSPGYCHQWYSYCCKYHFISD